MISLCPSHSRLFHGSEIKRASIYHSVKPNHWLTRYGDHIHYVQSDQVSEIILHICFLQIVLGVPLLFAGSCILRRSRVIHSTYPGPDSMVSSSLSWSDHLALGDF